MEYLYEKLHNFAKFLGNNLTKELTTSIDI